MTLTHSTGDVCGMSHMCGRVGDKRLVDRRWLAQLRGRRVACVLAHSIRL